MEITQEQADMIQSMILDLKDVINHQIKHELLLHPAKLKLCEYVDKLNEFYRFLEAKPEFKYMVMHGTLEKELVEGQEIDVYTIHRTAGPAHEVVGYCLWARKGEPRSAWIPEEEAKKDPAILVETARKWLKDVET